MALIYNGCVDSLVKDCLKQSAMYLGFQICLKVSCDIKKVSVVYKQHPQRMFNAENKEHFVLP